MIDDILQSDNFVPTTHVPCLYSATVEGHKVFFLRQDDDLAVSAPNQDITNNGFDMIQKQLKEPLKMLGNFELYNRLDITQGWYFLK